MYRNLIQTEISQYHRLIFVTSQLKFDETTKCSTLSQLVFIMQYELKGTINERFIKDHTGEGLSDATFCELLKMKTNKTPEKHILEGEKHFHEWPKKWGASKG